MILLSFKSVLFSLAGFSFLEINCIIMEVNGANWTLYGHKPIRLVCVHLSQTLL